METPLSIIDAQYIAEYKIAITFSDGKRQEVDFLPFLKKHPHPAYNYLKKISEFKKFYLDEGNIVWNPNWNLIFPLINLYRNDLEKNLE